MAQAASVYPGVQNMLLAARALGLGATLTTWHLFVEPEFKKVLQIPRSVQTYAVIPVGWPRGNFGPVVRRSAADRVHRDRW
jgi:nitroreductase